MRKKIIIAAISFLMLAGFSSLSIAQETENESDITNRFGVGYRFGWMDDDDDTSTIVPDVDQKHSALLIYGLSPYTALQLEGSYATNWDFDTEFYSLFADLQLRMPMEEMAAYIFGGVGLQNQDFDDIFDSEDSMAWRAGIGAEYFMTEQTAVNAEGIYNFDDGDATFNSWELRLGLSYYF
ncbi:MAG: porin family protein [Candidatus Omnitrophota bacterium]